MADNRDQFEVEANLVSPRITKEQNAIALKFLVDVVDDTHQPMHVSRAEDKGKVFGLKVQEA